MQVSFGREDIIGKIRDYIENGATSTNPTLYKNKSNIKTISSAKIISSFETSDSESVPVLVLSCSPGTENSSVMAFCAKQASEHTDFQMVVHFAGVTTGSTSIYGLISRSVCN